jgi:energy-coupling factor transporter ATP-binding protein EcfA2
VPGAEARRRASEVLERFGLVEAADRRVSTYSGGMRRRLDLAAGLIGRPPVVLLDEPTTGLDPRSRQELWRIVDELHREGTTVLLTTRVRVADPADAPDAAAVLADMGERVDTSDGEIRIAVTDSAASAEAIRRLDARRLAIAAVELQRPTLDDVFLALTKEAA